MYGLRVPNWTLREVADARGCHVATVRRWPSEDGWPAPDGKVSNAFTYPAEHVRAWLDQHDLSADQWTMQRIAEELGITESLIDGARDHGHFPPPDGRHGIRPWWRPTTVRAWWAARQVPAHAWMRDRVAEYCELNKRSLPQSRLPSPDGVAVTTRWWNPKTIRTWWAPHAAQRLERARHRAEAEQVRVRTVDPDVWFGRDVAIHTGLSYESVRTYRRLGKMPEPDGMVGNRPWWRPATIRAWDRPATTGRPRRGRSAVTATASAGRAR